MDTDCAAAGEDRGGGGAAAAVRHVASAICRNCIESAKTMPKIQLWPPPPPLAITTRSSVLLIHIHKESLKSMRLQALLNCNRQTFRSSECRLCPCVPLAF